MKKVVDYSELKDYKLMPEEKGLLEAILQYEHDAMKQPEKAIKEDKNETTL